jgi:hypothetical protein
VLVPLDGRGGTELSLTAIWARSPLLAFFHGNIRPALAYRNVGATLNVADWLQDLVVGEFLSTNQQLSDAEPADGD